MSQQNAAPSSTPIPRELAENLQIYQTPQAVDEYSVYRLYPEEKRLFAKYYKRGESVLDLAAGLGRTTLLLHELGMAVRGVDISQVFVDTVKRRLPYLDMRVGSYVHIEEPDASFDHVMISLNGIDYAYPEAQRETVLRECARVLKPGGTFIYSSHNIKWVFWLAPRYPRQFLWKLRYSVAALKDRAYLVHAGLHTLFTSREYVIRHTERAGLECLEVVWLRTVGNARFDRFFSPYYYYVFKKPAGSHVAA